jgi:hypothetical protein
MRLTVATVTVFGEISGARTLEVRTGDVEENQVWLETEEVAEAEIESFFNALLSGPYSQLTVGL